MSTAAQWGDTLAAEVWQATGTEGTADLKQVAADRLAAHRQRRAAAAALASAQQAELETRQRQHREAIRSGKKDAQRRGASVVRETVLARYEQRESYREFLAAEAERAIAQAQAEAEIAARNARAVSEAQMALLAELDSFEAHPQSPREQALAHHQAETRGELAHALADIVLGARELIAEPPLLAVVEGRTTAPSTPGLTSTPAHQAAVREVSSAGLTVRLFEDIPTAPSPAEVKPRRGRQPVEDLSAAALHLQFAETLHALDEEIDFRHAPAFPQATVLDMQPIPGNLIEFPRELVAPRRSRPRLAEGPLYDRPEARPHGNAEPPQLRIFEVDAEQVAVPAFASAQADYPPSLAPHTVPEWQSLHLGAFTSEHATPSSASDAQTHLALPLHTAPIERRLMSAAVDLCCIGGAWLTGVTCVAQIAGPALRLLGLPLAALSGLAAFAVFTLLFQLLFFTLAEATPGMRYARIALCTFGEGNPSRRAMRRRVLSSVLAACPLGLGIAWTLLDNDKLGWHDRMSRMYQRAY